MAHLKYLGITETNIHWALISAKSYSNETNEKNSNKTNSLHIHRKIQQRISKTIWNADILKNAQGSIDVESYQWRNLE